jgi:hypothetical protein
MPGGLLALVCYGNENIVVNGNPDVTWFYKAFKRATHFSQEPIQISLDGPNLLQMDAPITVKAKIPRQGDLLSDLVLRVQLPDIFSKAYIRQDQSGNFILDRKYEFAWIRQIGVRMIDSVTFTVGGQKIQEFNGDYMINKAHTDLLGTEYAKWERLVGNVPELYDPSKGLYAGGSTGTGYPLVFNNNGPGASTTTPPNVNRPSIEARRIQVPLPFWFSETTFESLPLIALQYHEIEIMVVLC